MRELLRRLFLEPETPQVAVEIRPQAVSIVRVARDRERLSLQAAASLELLPGALQVSASENNVVDPDALRATLRSACERTGVLSGAPVALVLPDPVARVALLPLAEVPARGASEARDVIRFRLKQTLPFEARDSRVAFRREGAQIVAIVAASAVLDPYEAACRACGLVPGLVELSGMVLLDALRASRPAADRLLVNWDAGYVSLYLLREGNVALTRALTGPSADSADGVLREIQNTLLYYRERLGGSGLAGVAFRSAAASTPDVAARLSGELGVPVEAVELLDKALGLPSQAVAGAAASLFGRVA